VTPRILLGIVAATAVLGIAVAVLLRPAEDPTPTSALPPPRFAEETDSSGIAQVYDGDAAYAVGGGVAVLDCMRNGKPDLYFAGGANAAALYRNDSPIGGPLKFTQLADAATDLKGVLGAYPIDVDGDGHVDLVVLGKDGSVLLRGLGDCRFAQQPLVSGYTTAFSAKWSSNDQPPILAFGRYLKPDASGNPSADCDDNAVRGPRGDPLTLAPGFCALSMLFSDWDRSGRRDLRVTNDRQYYVNGQDQLWRVTDGEPPRAYTAADGWVNLQIWGMGIATYDLLGDGFPAVFLTSQADNKLQVLTSGASAPTYRDIALKRGVTLAQPFTGGDVRPSTAWHPEFADVNNDGFIDLFVSKGNVSAMPDYANRDPSDLLLGQPDGTFREIADAAGGLNFARGRGAALADFSLSGRLDLVEVNYGAPVRIWRNVSTESGNWLALRLQQSGANRDAIGAWIEVQAGKTTLRRELTVGGGHAGGQLGWTHFGLGPARNVRVRVQWPDGQLGAWQDVAVNEFAIADRDDGRIRKWTQ